MKINQQKQNSPAKTQPIPLTDESMFDLEELTDKELFGIVGGRAGLIDLNADVKVQLD